jgi:hypothetical protein
MHNKNVTHNQIIFRNKELFVWFNIKYLPFTQIFFRQTLRKCTKESTAYPFTDATDKHPNN